MRINELQIIDYKKFDELSLMLCGKSTVFFGVNGTGKSTVLSAINYLFRVWINRLNSSQGKSYESFEPEMIHVGSSKMQLGVKVELADEEMELKRVYEKKKPGKKQVQTYDVSLYKRFVDLYTEKYLGDDFMSNIPIFVNYGTNRSVLDIPLRIRTKHEFSQISAMDRAVDNEVSFRTFFEWFRNQEDLENQISKEKNQPEYQDINLMCVRQAIEAMIGNVSNLRVKRNPLCMVATKNEVEIRVDMLSDGEKCTIALLGDLARRLAIANPNRNNPLEGEGIVLIDEIELHMHPTWQRKILKVLRETFPNIQFIITTHSPQVLGEANDSYNVYLLDDTTNENELISIGRMDGFDSNMILERFMRTDSSSVLKQELIYKINTLISQKNYVAAEEKLQFLKSLSGEQDENYIMLQGYIKRSKILDEKN